MSREPSRRIVVKGVVERRHEADDLASQPGDVILVVRRYPRSAVVACPDGCGEILTVNLDPAAGPAWSLYRTSHGLSLYPSVWRESGCRSHFIVWSDRIIWCDRFEEGNREPDEANPQLVAVVLERLTRDYRPYAAVAKDLEEIPWEVMRACRTLVKAGRAQEGTRRQRGWFRRRGW